MASLIFDSITRSGSSYTWTWSGTGPYDVWLRGDKLEEQTTDETYTLHSSDSEEPPPLEVVDLDADAATVAENYQHNPHAALQWRGIVTCEQYLVERYVGAAWTEVERIPEDASGYYRYDTPVLTDATAEQFRVTAIDYKAEEGIPLVFSFTPICNPVPPSISISYSSVTGNVTVSAR